MQRLGRLLFRYRSFTPVPALMVAAVLVARSRGPASRLWLVAGFALCLGGQALRAWVLGIVQDGTSGQNEKLIAVSLNTRGPYARTRNPLYLGNLGIVLGLALIAHDLWLLLLCSALFALQYWFIIAAEEDFLRGRFGATYAAYCARVPRFWPRLFKSPAGAVPRTHWNWPRIVRKEHNPCAAWLALALALLWLDHRDSPRPYLASLAVVAVLWLSAKAWKHRWLSGNFLTDLRRRLSRS
jgi:protein-S-isoprenylcysteine O-methyltransferase Ste14